MVKEDGVRRSNPFDERRHAYVARGNRCTICSLRTQVGGLPILTNSSLPRQVTTIIIHFNTLTTSIVHRRAMVESTRHSARKH